MVNRAWREVMTPKTQIFSIITTDCQIRISKLHIGCRELQPIEISKGAFADDIVLIASKQIRGVRKIVE